MIIQPGPVRGVVRVPGSKSLTHRAVLMAAQSSRPCDVVGGLEGADTQATLGAMDAFGAMRDGWAFSPAELHAGDVDCANSGTTLRLTTATAARFDGPSRFDGDASLRGRPNGPLLDALRGLDARIDGGPTCPYIVRGPMQAGDVVLPPQVSSQYASGLLLSLPMLDGDSTLRPEPPVSSRPYLDLTLGVARAGGLRIDVEGDAFHIPGGQRPDAARFEVEGDWSTAAFPLVAGAIAGDVTVEGLDEDSRQGDKRILDILRAFGADVQGTRVREASLRSPGLVDVADGPDMFPALCVLAACAEGMTTFTGGAALRHKESDRIAAMAAGLQAMGIDCTETEDGLVVVGGRLHAAAIDSRGDHRIHMAFCTAALVADGPVTVSEPDCVAVSHPDFHRDLHALQAGAP